MRFVQLACFARLMPFTSPMKPIETVIRVTQPNDSGVAPLLAALDAYLYQQYPVDEFAHDVNHILSPAALQQPNVTFLAAWQGNHALGCGALRQVDGGAYGEIKRMFVAPAARGERIGQRLLAALETQARANGLTLLKLEAGTRQPEALRLYERAGFGLCERFGDYAPNPVSVYLEKLL